MKAKDKENMRKGRVRTPVPATLQNTADYRTFLRAIRDKRIEAVVEDEA